MKFRTAFSIFLFGASTAILGALLPGHSKADAPQTAPQAVPQAAPQAAQEVQPYEFAHVPVAFHDVDVKVYKMVHEGCEIYIATNSAVAYQAASLAIATGRGCK